MNKIIKTFLKTFTTLFFITILIKLLGLDTFGLDTSNKVIVSINDFATRFYLVDIIKVIFLGINSYYYIALSSNNYKGKTIIYSIIITLVSVPLKIYLSSLGIGFITTLIDIVLLNIYVLIYCLFVIKSKRILVNELNFTFVIISNFLYQFFSNIIRGLGFDALLFTEYFILNFDYILLMLITCLLFYKKGEINLWIGVVGLFGDQLRSYGQLLASFGASLKFRILLLKESSKKPLEDGNSEKEKKTQQNLKKQKNETLKKINYNEFALKIIFLILFLIWNIFTVIVILFIAKLNDRLLEGSFILVSFMINKAAFGKPLHLKKAINCFAISNLSWWIFTRVSLPIGISFVVPILIGVLVAYGATQVALYLTTELHRGMSKEEVETICDLHKIEGTERLILLYYFTYKMTITTIAIKLNYSEINIYKLKAKALDKIKNKG